MVRTFASVFFLTFVFLSTAQAQGTLRWKEVGTNALGVARTYHTGAVFNGRMWLIGGITDGGGSHADVISSADGSTWRKESDLPMGVIQHASVVFNNRLWILGGNSNSNGPTASVLSSGDGSSWTEVGALPVKLQGHAATVFNGRMWVFGGIANENRSSAVYSSSDGSDWMQEQSLPTPLSYPSVQIFGGKMWLTGGTDANNQDARRVYVSSDGNAWTEVGTNALPLPLSAHASGVFQNMLWTVGGFDSATYTSRTKVLTSTDGANWTQHAHLEMPSGVHNPVVLPFAGTLWVLGGGSSNDARHRKVYSLQPGEAAGNSSSSSSVRTGISPSSQRSSASSLSAQPGNTRVWLEQRECEMYNEPGHVLLPCHLFLVWIDARMKNGLAPKLGDTTVEVTQSRWLSNRWGEPGTVSQFNYDASTVMHAMQILYDPSDLPKTETYRITVAHQGYRTQTDVTVTFSAGVPFRVSASSAQSSSVSSTVAVDMYGPIQHDLFDSLQGLQTEYAPGDRLRLTLDARYRNLLLSKENDWELLFWHKGYQEPAVYKNKQWIIDSVLPDSPGKKSLWLAYYCRSLRCQSMYLNAKSMKAFSFTIVPKPASAVRISAPARTATSRTARPSVTQKKDAASAKMRARLQARELARRGR